MHSCYSMRWKNKRHFTLSTILFFEQVLYLDADDKLPNALKSTEQPEYMLGFTKNVGGELTFKILDNQTKRVVSVSVVQPYKDNNRVQFDLNVKQNKSLVKCPIDINKLQGTS